MPCEIDMENAAVNEHVLGIRNPWIRAGPQCPSNLRIIEGPLRPRSVWEKHGKVNINVNACYESWPEPMMLPPSDGLIEVIERGPKDKVYEDVFDETKTRLPT